MNHLFLIQAHHQPELCARIVKKLQDPTHYFYIHVDKKKNISLFKTAMAECRNIDWCDELRMNVNWGGPSQFICTISLLKKALLNDICFDYIHLMSGVCYPIVNNDAFNLFFERNKGKSFMYFDSLKEVEEWRKNKYPMRLKWHFNDYSYLNKLHVSGILNRFAPRKPVENLYAGWSWWSWHRSLVVYVVDYLKKHPKYFKRFLYTTCCDEVIFHTMLFEKAKELNIEKYNSLRYIDWHPKRHAKTLPLVLDERDYEEIKHSGCLFCRKVDETISEKLLDLLDK